MDPLFAFSVTAILGVSSLLFWVRLVTIDNRIDDQRERMERWFVWAAMMTTVTIVWAIVSIINFGASVVHLAMTTPHAAEIAL